MIPTDFESAKRLMVELRWRGGRVSCPVCGSKGVTWLAKDRVWKCYGGHRRAKFSLKTGTIFEGSAVPLEKWLAAVWIVLGGEDGVSSRELQRALGVTQKTAWFVAHRIRLAAMELPGTARWTERLRGRSETERFRGIVRGLLRVSKSQLDRQVEQARATSPRLTDENAPGRRRVPLIVGL